MGEASITLLFILIDPCRICSFASGDRNKRTAEQDVEVRRARRREGSEVSHIPP